MTLTTGQLIHHDRYRIIKLLGQGGFGAVYRAWDTSMEKPCAIKENLEASEAAQRQFKREALLLGNLSHPNLPRVTDHFTIPSQGQYLVMDFIEGLNLEEILARNKGALQEKLALGWIDQVCAALSYLHEQGVIHRDIKPANIRISPTRKGREHAEQSGVSFDALTSLPGESQAFLVDFGIAKSGPSQQTTIGAKAVTSGYSPPEQYGGQGHTDKRSDIYSLGATMYCLLSGKPPPDSVEVVSGVLPPPLAVSAANPAVSENTSKVVMKAISIHRDRRWGSVEEMLRRVEAGPPR